MAVELNHTIVSVRDKHEAATFLTDLLGVPEPTAPPSTSRPYGSGG